MGFSLPGPSSSETEPQADMSWRAITEDDLRSSITSGEDVALRTALIASGQADPFTQVAGQVVRSFRDAIRSNPKNRLHADETYLPEGAIYHAVAVIRFRLLSRFVSELITDDRRLEQKQAMDWLGYVRAGKELIEDPDGEGTETDSGGRLEQLTPSRRRADREGLKGL